MQKLENMILGKHYFKIALLLRDSLFLNGILYSSEAWYGLKESEIMELEKLDNILLRNIFEVPMSAPVISLYLESGCVRIRNILRARRLNFLHHLVNLDNDEMEYKFFKAQWDHPCPQDWTSQVKNDMIELGLPTSIEFVKSKSERIFKELVRKKVKSYEFSKLMEARKSKTKNIIYSNRDSFFNNSILASSCSKRFSGEASGILVGSAFKTYCRSFTKESLSPFFV